MWFTSVQISISGLLLGVLSNVVQANVLQPDPAWEEKKLDNGFSWQFLATPQRPNDNIELRLVVKTGSLIESPKQTGFSYLIPQIGLHHSVTLSSEQLQGLWQQAKNSAATSPQFINSYGFTMYSLSLPNNRSELLKTALTWLSDIAGKLPITPNTVATALRLATPITTFPLDISDPWWRYRLKGSAMLGHDPVQPSGSIDSKALAEFYQQNYTPDVMTLYVVGNIDNRGLHEHINKLFSGLQGRRQAVAPIATLAPMLPQPVNLIGASDTPNTLSLVWDRSWTSIRDDQALLRYWLSDLAREAMFIRLQQSLSDHKSNGRKLSFNCSVLFQRSQCRIDLETAHMHLKPSLEQMANVLKDLEKNGLSEAEYRALLVKKKAELTHFFATYARADTGILINQRFLSQQNNMVDIAPEKYQLLRQVFLSSLTPAILTSELQNQIALPPVLVLVQPKGEPEGSVQELLALYNSIVKPPVAKESAEETKPAAIAEPIQNTLPKGEVIKPTTDPKPTS